MDERLARTATLAGIVGVVLGALAAWLAAAPAPLPADDFDPAPPTRERGEDAPAPPQPFGFRHEHPFLQGDGSATFEVPPNPRAADVAIWFDGAAAPSGSLTIRVLAPDGTVELETSLPSASVQVGVAGRIQEARLEGVVLPPGTHVVEYVGTGTLTGHVEVNGGA